MSIEITECEKKTTWDGFVAKRPEANFLQSWDFYEFHIARGKKIVRRAVMDGESIVGVYAGVVETAKRGRYLAIAGGPIVDWADKKLEKDFFLKMVLGTEGETYTVENGEYYPILPAFDEKQKSRVT